MQKFYVVSRPGENVRITIPIRDWDTIAIIEENLAIAEGLKDQVRKNWDSILAIQTQKEVRQ